jgi:hypothetical protein
MRGAIYQAGSAIIKNTELQKECAFSLFYAQF